MKSRMIFNFHFSFFNFLMMLLLTGCQREADLPETTSAAKEIYMQYANRKDLTVALIGDYQGYNAVMLQAQDAEGWLRLCKEFAVNEHIEVSTLDTNRVSSLKTMSFTADTVSFFGNPDTMQLPGIIGEFFGNLLDSVMRNETGHLLRDTAFAVTRHERWVNGQLVDTGSDTVIGNEARRQTRPNDRLLNTANDHGNGGYLIHGDSQSLALWLFFYSTPEELTQILNTIAQ